MIDIDVAIFEFIAKLKKVEFKPAQNHHELKGNEPTIDIGEVKDFGIGRIDRLDGSIISKYIDVNGSLTGLDEVSYAGLKEMVSGLLNKEPFASLADAQFLV